MVSPDAELCLEYTLEVFIDGIQQRAVPYNACSQDAYCSQSEYPALITPMYMDPDLMAFPDPPNDLDSSVGDLDESSSRRQGIPEAAAWVVLRSVAEALRFIHHRGEGSRRLAPLPH